jgi:hypothetical protein
MNAGINSFFSRGNTSSSAGNISVGTFRTVEFPVKYEMVEPQDRQVAWTYDAEIDSAARRRGDQ